MAASSEKDCPGWRCWCFFLALLQIPQPPGEKRSVRGLSDLVFPSTLQCFILKPFYGCPAPLHLPDSVLWVVV